MASLDKTNPAVSTEKWNKNSGSNIFLYRFCELMLLLDVKKITGTDAS